METFIGLVQMNFCTYLDYCQSHLLDPRYTQNHTRHMQKAALELVL